MKRMRRSGRQAGSALLTLLLAAHLAAADPSVAAVFGDHMVVQRGQPILVWGSADPGARVAVTLGEQRAAAVADASGSWVAILPAMQASGPLRLTVGSGRWARTYADVRVGDVWLASGQSNMNWGLGASSEWADVRGRGRFPEIRICKLPGTHALEPADGYARPIAWSQLDSARAHEFSAVAYHFACTIQPQAGVAIGVIQGSCGGTMAEQWTPLPALHAADPRSTSRCFADRERALAALAADPSARIGATQAGAAALYQGTIHPIRHLRFAGVLWYQGEANSRNRDDYRPRLATLIGAWRAVFEQPALPWVIVQLPGFGLATGDGWMRVQEAQAAVAQEFGLALVTTVDQGSATTIHPANKEVIGRRAGLAAVQRVYGRAVDGTAPQPLSLRRVGTRLVIAFDEELVVRGGAVAGFEVAAADGSFAAAAATVVGRTVEVEAPDAAARDAVRYLWKPHTDPITLFDRSGLPVGPFQITGDASRATP